MKTIILYTSKNGTTEKCALKLKQKLGEVKVVNLRIETPNIEDYDNIIIGSAIRMGTLMKEARKFINSNESLLCSKKLGIFVCNGTIEATDDVINANLSQEIIESSIAIMSFGGELNIDKLKGMDKFIAKMVTKNTEGRSFPCILEDKIEEFAKLFI